MKGNKITADIGCFQLSNILNLDETPIPFEYLEGRTYDIKGSKTIAGKTDGSGWDKRQATLILYIFADGIPRIKPKLIFHGKTGDAIAKKEGHMWSKNVTVLFNPTAYNNELIFSQFIYEELIPVLHNTAIHHRPATPTSLPPLSYTTANSNPVAYHPPQLNADTSGPTPLPIQISTSNQTKSGVGNTFQTSITNQIPNSYIPYSLLLMDQAAFHVTPAILSTLRSHRIIPSIIPGGCTGLLQPLDTEVNKPFKEYLREYTDIYLDEQAANGQDMTTSSVSDKRILTTHVVGRAWSAFCQQKQYLIRKAFSDVGVTLPISGTCDDEIHIK